MAAEYANSSEDSSSRLVSRINAISAHEIAQDHEAQVKPHPLTVKDDQDLLLAHNSLASTNEADAASTSATASSISVTTSSTSASAASSNATAVPVSVSKDSENTATAKEEDLATDSITALSSGAATAINMTRTTHEVDLLSGNKGPQLLRKLNLSLEHPDDLQESFIQAGASTIIAYSSEKSNINISLKISPLDHDTLQGLTLAELKEGLTHRFNDRDNMLSGQYTLIKAKEDKSQERDLNQRYFDVTLKGSLVKGEDGILPDMHNFFYERTIVNGGYITTLTCELFGRQAHSSIVKQQFNLLSPLCERIINGYTYSFH